MNDAQRKILQQERALSRKPDLRRGEVIDATPGAVTVALGGSTDEVPAQTILGANVAVGDIVDVLAAGNRPPLILAAGFPAGTSLPASPSDGDAYVYNADTTNGVKWPLQYRSGASGSYKWESLGGPWLEKNVATAYNQTTANTWQQLNSSLQITLPLSGYYDFELVTYAYDNAGTNGKIIVAPYANSPAAVAGPHSYNFHGFNGGYGISARGTGRTGLCNKNYPLRFYVFSNPGAFTMQDWWIRVRPVRVG